MEESPEKILAMSPDQADTLASLHRNEHAPEPGTVLVYSNKSPEEASIFGLRGDDIRSVVVPKAEAPPVSPEEWEITEANGEGICKYCQLMLHPDAPEITTHQPDLQSLIDSTCRVCGWIEVSIVRGLPELASSYSQNPSGFQDEASAITVSISKHAQHHIVVPTVGSRVYGAGGKRYNPSPIIPDRGVPLNVSRISQLGSLASHRFWQPYGTDQQNPQKRLETVKEWLRECRDHEDCAASFAASRNARLPTRLLDLTGSPDVPSDIEDIKLKLLETTETDRGSYTALSYCWGGDHEHHFMTTRATLASHKESIDFASLPLTHREAILATLYLGIRYLWIDSICIIQDDPLDWQTEAARMSSAYSNAILTLAATSSKTPADGLLNPFQAPLCEDLYGERVMIRFETGSTIDASTEPLNTRAWALQEKILSPRYICFGGEQWLWQCTSRYATEDGLIDYSRKDSGQERWMEIIRRGGDLDDDGFFKSWCALVHNYSKRSLAFESDKLKALTGLVDACKRQRGFVFLAGIWKADLASGLYWTATSQGVRREETRIPSWSWISTEGPVVFPARADTTFRGHNVTPIIQFLDVQEQWEGVPLSSQIQVARLTVQGIVIAASLGPRSKTQMLRHHLVSDPGSDEILGETFLDNADLVDKGVSEVRCLFVYSEQDSADDVEYFVLLLVPAPEHDGQDEFHAYRRIGAAVIWERSRFNNSRDKGVTALERALPENLVLV